MLILGIDPGLAIVGWGVVECSGIHCRAIGYGSIETPAGMDTPDRLLHIRRGMDALLRRYRPDEMAIEELFFTKNITTGIRVAEARGIILLAGAEAGIPMAEYTPMQVKQAVVGYGLAEKHQVIGMVTRLLKLSAPPRPDDTADALAIALCHAQSSGSRLAKYFNNT